MAALKGGFTRAQSARTANALRLRAAERRGATEGSVGRTFAFLRASSLSLRSRRFFSILSFLSTSACGFECTTRSPMRNSLPWRLATAASDSASPDGSCSRVRRSAVSTRLELAAYSYCFQRACSSAMAARGYQARRPSQRARRLSRPARISRASARARYAAQALRPAAEPCGRGCRPARSQRTMATLRPRLGLSSAPRRQTSPPEA